MNRVLVLCPSRNNPDGFRRLAESIRDTSQAADLVAYIDNDQREMYMAHQWGKLAGRVLLKTGPRIGPVASLNALVAAYPGYSAYGILTDDTVVVTPGWDDWVLAAIAQCPNRIGVISPRHNLGEHVDQPFVSAEWIKVVGWYAYPKAFHFVWPIITGLIGEMSAIIHAPEGGFEIHHDEADHHGNREHAVDDHRAFFEFVALELPATVERVRQAMTEKA